ncbi:helix-turn-helix transcriptional regulator [Pseudorhodoferax sp.]|uniref:helix-turn-helix transcriptional regulator n=1 Tax=Pseudorhodoferax sp. TaxID=1993553 RepID=UPI002DD676F0|nr:WYL domain-containing protein [Pseudorhodoferax sp.]
MAKTDRLYKIERLIRSRGHLSFQALQDELEVSPATLKRDLEYLRDRLGAPIEYDRDLNGYRFASGWGGPKHELPGLWFDERELYSLLMAHQLLSELDSNGVISRHLQPLLDRIHALLGGDEAEAAGLVRRVRIISPAKRPVPGSVFERVAEALLERRRLHMRYHTRGRREVGEREVSPQRLVHYRATWYLDAWCHTRERLLRFALDAIEAAQVREAKARPVPLRQVQAEMDAGYGIYAGGTPQWAVLHFDAQAAPWASREQWHAGQQGRWLDGGRYELRVPYVDETEIVMDVLRQGPEVEVVAPPALRERVRGRLAEAAARYAAPD